MNERPDGYTSQKWKRLSFLSSSSSSAYDYSQWLPHSKKRQGLFRDEEGDGRPVKRGNFDGVHAAKETQSAKIGLTVAVEQHY